eukprot:GEMP01026637.1.p1 GENE.GEMP01026637.1~~GEMP01026637.1.p1  ORF type:complete len:421 (+),score=86.11 GEMP01026637.1:169-1431(+)
MCSCEYCAIALCTNVTLLIQRAEHGRCREIICVVVLLILSVVAAFPSIPWVTITPIDNDGSAPALLYGTDPPAHPPYNAHQYYIRSAADMPEVISIWTVSTMLPLIMLALSFTCLTLACPMASTGTPRHCLIVISLVAVVLQGTSTTAVLIAHSITPQSVMTAAGGLVINLVSQVTHGILLILLRVHRVERARGKVVKTAVPLDRHQVYGGVTVGNVELAQLEEGARCRKELKHSTVTTPESCTTNMPNMLCSIALLLDLMAFWLPWDVPGDESLSRKLWEDGVLNMDIAMVAGVFAIVVGVHVEGDELHKASIFMFSLAAHLWAVADIPAFSHSYRAGPKLVILSAVWVLTSAVILLRENAKTRTTADVPEYVVEPGATEAWGNAGGGKPNNRENTEDLVVGRPLPQQRMENFGERGIK